MRSNSNKHPWSALQPFGGEGAIGSPGGTHPLAADGDTVHGVWMQGGKIHYRVSRDAGQTWVHSFPLTSGSTAQYPCSLEVCGDNLHLIWPDSRHEIWEMYYKRSTDGGETWGEDTQLAPHENLFRLGTTADGPLVHVVWGSSSSTVQTEAGLHTWGEIYYRRSVDGGRTWEPLLRLTEPESTAMRPAIAVWDQYVHVTWFDKRDSKGILDWETYVKRSTDRGATWGEDIRLSHTPHHTRHPQIVTTTGGRVCCFWEDGQRYEDGRWFGDAALFASVSDNHGESWDEPERLTFVNAPHSWATHSKSYASGNRVHLAWTDSPEGPNGRQAAYYMTSPDGGASWEAPEQLLLASEHAPHETWVQGVAGTESYAVVLISTPHGLHYRRRDLAGAPNR